MSDTSKKMTKVIVDALDDKKGIDIRVLNISNVTVIADYFVIASGSNINHVKALVDNVEEKMAEAGFDYANVEGHNNSTWILLDYKDVIVHVFSSEDRMFYDLERIWRDGVVVDKSEL
ncbi:MAG: ribosome silencing factor [Lachnospira sp.]